MQGTLKIVGLGPGEAGYITRETWKVLKAAKSDSLFLRTEIHPTVESLNKEGIRYQSYDHLYEAAQDFETLYQRIVEDLIARVKDGADIVYAVPGSPVVAEKTVRLLRACGCRENLDIQVYAGLSFFELLCTTMQLDPVEGVAILDAVTLPEILPTLHLVITQVYDQQVASDLKLNLMEGLGDDTEIWYIHNLGLPDVSVRKIPLYELDRQSDIDHLTSIYIPKPVNK
ncbi:hypothetical protein TAMA11512_14180 [Selenomonas sp. TAMA-11512]|uniref:SAM-dependent methyltransferase n=1 Tax=Selenomonas sp. TAMA-11512 TaxID=3095337 RepID=UPI003089C9CB|nr:hypothetical protein TAMA11512_14180 [Selenomonas sp. TAMA-11512]